MTTSQFIICQIILFFVVPVILAYFWKAPFRYRFYFLFLTPLSLIGIIFSEQQTLRDIGIRIDNLATSIIPYCLFTLLGTALLIYIAKLRNKKLYHLIFTKEFLGIWLLHVGISVLQQFSFSGFLLPKLQILFEGSLAPVFLTYAFLFSFLHIIYRNKNTVLPLTFLSGLGFSGIYYFFPNLILISFSHTILNNIFVAYRFLEE